MDVAAITDAVIAELHRQGYVLVRRDEPEQVTARISVMDVVQVLADRSGLTPDVILGPTRQRSVAQVRREAFYVTHHALGMSSARVGKVIGDRDPSSVSTGAQRHVAALGSAAKPRAEALIAAAAEASWARIERQKVAP